VAHQKKSTGRALELQRALLHRLHIGLELASGHRLTGRLCRGPWTHKPLETQTNGAEKHMCQHRLAPGCPHIDNARRVYRQSPPCMRFLRFRLRRGKMSPEYCAMPSTLQHPCYLSHSVSNMIPTWHRSKPQPPPSNGSGIANIPHSCFLLSAHGDRRAHAPRNALLTGKKACSQAGTLSGACAGTYSNVLVNTGHWLRKRPRTQHTQGAGAQTAGRESASH